MNAGNLLLLTIALCGTWCVGAAQSAATANASDNGKIIEQTTYELPGHCRIWNKRRSPARLGVIFERRKNFVVRARTETPFFR